MTASGGTLDYTYSWNTSPVQNSPTATGLTEGTYTVTVTDADNNQATTEVTITEPVLALSANISDQNDASCFGAATGSATVAVNGGTPNYTYSWNTTPVQTTATASNLKAGPYTVTVTDSKNCQTTADVTIGQPGAALAANISAQVNVDCFGAATGSATVTVNGGTPNYTYSWNTTPVQTTATASNLKAGPYTVTVTDSKNCQTTADVTIGQPGAALAANISAQVNAGCFGAATGSATVAVNGGTPNYTYSWNTTPVQTTATASNPKAGLTYCDG